MIVIGPRRYLGPVAAQHLPQSPQVVHPVRAAAPPGPHPDDVRTGPDLDAHARALMDANLYVTLGTADALGTPWASPVYFATADYAELFWVSELDAQHSRNIAARPQLSMVIFDSTVPVYHGRAVYLSGTASDLADRDLDRGLEVFAGAAGRAVTALAPEDVTAPSTYRLYRATVTEAYVLCPREPRRPCPVHDIAADHRARVLPWRHAA